MVLSITRRQFLLVNASAGVVALVPTAFGRGLTIQEQQTLLAVARTIFPHDQVPDRVYLRAVSHVDARCCADTTFGDVMTRGLLTLDCRCGGSFVELPPSARVAALRAMRGSRFFDATYAELLEAVYGPPEMWTLFVPAADGEA